VAIQVHNLSKRYRLGERQRYKALRDTLTDALYGPFRAAGSVFSRRQATIGPVADTHFWALDNVSFEIKPGEIVGIIGRNGAGKSTLLKILSRITEPTRGHAAIRGRVGSLLEVGTGFHQELTGRENIYLNGAILGMKRAEIDRQFDEIVAFAEVEKFIDTQVKRYSSGMYVRLAFAVAAHLQPDILIVDEVLAVGDLAFQKKCLDWIAADTQRRNVTALYVSHNISTIKSLCTRAILLQEGRLIRQGSVQEVCNEYAKTLNDGIISAIRKTRLETSEEATIYDCWFEAAGGRVSQLTLPDTLTIHAVVDVHKRCLLAFESVVKNELNQPFALAQYGLAKQPPLDLGPGRYDLEVRFPYLGFANGRYSFDVSIGEPNRRHFDYIEDALELAVVGTGDPLTGWHFNQSTRQGAIVVDCELTAR